jgi:hypothetical protein
LAELEFDTALVDLSSLTSTSAACNFALSAPISASFWASRASTGGAVPLAEIRRVSGRAVRSGSLTGGGEVRRLPGVTILLVELERGISETSWASLSRDEVLP